MATEDLQGGIFPNQAQPPSPAPSTLPPYPEMIMAAIEALNEPNGSNKSSITRQIEATYGELAPAHSALLTHHLNKMKASGQLAFLKNNYLKPDPNSPPRRGRGRPPKPKTPLPAGTVLPPPRPRGRPPKSHDTTAPPPPPKPKAAASPTLSGKKRGRPPKSAGGGVSAPPQPLTPPPAAAASPGGTPRGRGRPPKVKPAVAAPVGA